MRSVSLAATARNSFNHNIFARIDRCRLGNSTVCSLNHSRPHRPVLHISIKQLIFKTKCPILPVFNYTVLPRLGEVISPSARIARLVCTYTTSKKVTNNHARTPPTTRRRRPQSTSSPTSPLVVTSTTFVFFKLRHFTFNGAALPRQFLVNPFFLRSTTHSAVKDANEPPPPKVGSCNPPRRVRLL